jgi:branched-chain amino acid transport system substrate-binding protein
MRSPKSRSRPAAALAAAALAVVTAAGCAAAGQAGTGSAAPAAAAPVKVGMVTSQTGPLSEYAKEYLAGFDAGLAYVTGGTGKIGGHPVQVITEDDQGSATTAVNDAKDLIGKGATILAGSVDSGIALQVAAVAAQNKVLFISGAAATGELDDLNRYTFRSGRESYQDVATAGTFLTSAAGKHVLVLAQDTAFGQANVAAVQAVLGGQGATVSSTLVPTSATDFTPFASKILAAKPDLVFVAWAGATATALWTTLDQQGVIGSTQVVTGLANRATYPVFGAAGSKIEFLAHYFPGAGGGNPVEQAMTTAVDKTGGTVDLFTPDGFTAAQLLARALGGSATDVDAQIKALEGWSFQGVLGRYTVRAADHALLQPEFQARLTGSSTTWTAQLVKTVDPQAIAPPVPAKPAW